MALFSRYAFCSQRNVCLVTTTFRKTIFVKRIMILQSNATMIAKNVQLALIARISLIAFNSSRCTNNFDVF